MDIDKILEIIKTLKLKSADLLIIMDMVRNLSIEVGEISNHLAKTAEISKGIILKIEEVRKGSDGKK